MANSTDLPPRRDPHIWRDDARYPRDGLPRDLAPPLHAGLPVAGYRPQPTSNVELVNAMKAAEERVLRQLDVLAQRDDIDKRWLAAGRTDIEKGFMAVNRSVFRPQRVPLPGDTTTD